MKVPGIDGQKMSKSYNNTIPIFASEAEVRKQVMRIVTDSKRPEEPKDPQDNNLFTLLSFFASPERLEEIRQLYLHGGAAYGELKKELAELILSFFSEPRERFAALINNRTYLDDVLGEGARKARAMGQPYLAAARKATGID
jgi:tryptophanyl-tRNA synthetase